MARAMEGLGGFGEPPPGAGYGLAPAQEPCPSGDPQFALKECIRAAQQLLEDTIQRAESVPWEHPPYRARWVCDFVQVVLAPTAALNPVGAAAGAAILAANTLAGPPAYAPTLVPIPAAGSFQTIYQVSPPQGNMIRIASWGIDSGNVAPRFVAMGIQAATVGGPPSPPNPFSGGAEAAEQEPTFALLQPDQNLRLTATLRDLNTAALLDIGVCYWIWPVNKRVDSRQGTILRSGYGTGCDL